MVRIRFPPPVSQQQTVPALGSDGAAGGGPKRVYVILTTCYTKRLTHHDASRTRL